MWSLILSTFEIKDPLFWKLERLMSVKAAINFDNSTFE